MRPLLELLLGVVPTAFFVASFVLCALAGNVWVAAIFGVATVISLIGLGMAITEVREALSERAAPWED